jgi:3-methyladenine DNA glycosylase/8-oxoguanine DNA glycosylase
VSEDGAVPDARRPPPDAVTVVHCREPVDLRLTIGSLRRGPADPHLRLDATRVVRAFRTPQGPATLELRLRPADGDVDAAAWGPGAQWALDSAPALLGCGDDPKAFVPELPLLRDLKARHPGMRVPRSGLVFDSLVPAVLEQKVTGTEAKQSWRQLLWRFGEPAPGWPELRVLPSPTTIKAIPSWEWHRAGVEQKRAGIIRNAAAFAARVDECADLPMAAAYSRLQSLPGIGPWTAAEVAQRALGDADAVSVGDYHLHTVVGYALAGRDVDDAAMLELLEPYRPHRFRVCRLLELGVGRPRFGPRMSVREIRSL